MQGKRVKEGFHSKATRLPRSSSRATLGAMVRALPDGTSSGVTSIA